MKELVESFVNGTIIDTMLTPRTPLGVAIVVPINTLFKFGGWYLLIRVLRTAWEHGPL